MLKSALLILSGNMAASLLLLIRNLIVARLIPVADYGIASTFAIAMTLVEMITNLGLQQQIIQAKNGEDPRFQAALQGFQVLRGVFAGVVLFVLADTLTDFLNVPEATWAYQLMALVPVLNALKHFDIHRMNRSMVFWPLILTGAVPALLSVMAVWPLAIIYGDYKVMLYAILIQVGMTAVVSHVVAERPYRLLLDRRITVQSLRFGWPLLVNGILLFGIFQGDKVVVGRELGMEVLAIFAMGFTLTLTPTLVMAQSAQNFFLPQLSGLDRSTEVGRDRFQYLSMVTIQISILNGVLLVAGVFLLGGPLVEVVLGEKYLSLTPLLVPLAVMQAVRVAKTGAAIVALSSGHTSNAMQTNLVRILALPLAWCAVIQGADILVVIVIATIGELTGYVLSFILVARKPGVALRPILWPVLTSMGFLGAVMLFPLYANTPVWMRIFILGALFIVTMVSMKETRGYIARRRFQK